MSILYIYLILIDCIVFLIKLKQKIASATSAIKSVFGQEQTQDDAVRILHLDLVFIWLLYNIRNIPFVLSYVDREITAFKGEDDKSEGAFSGHRFNRICHCNYPHGNHL